MSLTNRRGFFMDYFETVKRRHSVRSFNQQPVAHEDVLAMLGAATLAPSATNQQPWHFIVIRDRQLKEAMRDIVSAILRAAVAGTDDSARSKRLSRMHENSVHFAGAPVAIAVLARPWVGGNGEVHPDATSRDLALQSVAMAVDQLMLAATALGYGSCYASAPAEFAREEMEALLGVESPWFLLGIISLGRPTGKLPRRAPRRSVAEVCTFIE